MININPKCKKKWVIIILCLCMFCLWVDSSVVNGESRLNNLSASQNKQNIHISSGVFFMQDIKQLEFSSGIPIFLFSKLILSNTHKGNIFIVGGLADIKGSILGNIYSIGANLTLADNAFVSGKIYKFSYKIFNFINIVIGIILLFISKNFFLQASAVVLKEPVKTINYGGLFYTLSCALIAIFALSVVGFPIALIFVLIIIAFTCCGSVSLALCVGSFINKTVVYNTFLCYFLGSVIIEFIKLTPYLGIIFTFIVIPVITAGIILKSFANRLIFKTYFSIPSDTMTFDRAAVKQIILREGEKDD